jgi:hypothetical protein
MLFKSKGKYTFVKKDSQTNNVNLELKVDDEITKLITGF